MSRGAVLDRAEAELTGTLSFKAELSATITANTDDFNPGGLASRTLLLVDVQNAAELRGVAGGNRGRTLLFVNRGDSILTFKNEAATSVAGNRFITPNLVDFTLSPGASIWLVWQSVDDRWHIVAPVQATGAGGPPTGAAGGVLTGTYPNPDGFATGSVQLDDVQQITTARFLGRTTAATGVVEQLTAAQATAMLDPFVGSGTGSLKGLVPNPGSIGGSTRFLNENGTWGVPAGGGISLPVAPYRALVYRSGATYFAKALDGSTIASGSGPAAVLLAACNAVEGLGGGTVFVAAGTYVFGTTTVNVPGNVYVIGEAAGGRFNDGGNLSGGGTIFEGNGDGILRLTAVISPTHGYGQVVANIAFVNNGSQTNSRAVQVWGMDTTVFNCTFDGFAQAYDDIGNTITTGSPSTAAVGNRVCFCVFTGNLNAINVDRLGQANAPTDGQIIGCRFLTPTGTGAQYNVDIAAGGWHILMCHFTEATGGAKHLRNTSNRFLCANNYFDTSGVTYKMDLSSCTESTFMNNFILAGLAGVVMNVGTNFGSIVGNFFQGDDATTNAIRYNGVATGLRGACYANSFANFVGHPIIDSAGEPIPNGFTAGAGIWPAFKADGNVAWT